MVLPTDSVGNWSALAQAATDANTVKVGSSHLLTPCPPLLAPARAGLPSPALHSPDVSGSTYNTLVSHLTRVA